MARKHLTMFWKAIPLAAVLIAAAACAPRGKAYGPVPSAERALQVAKLELGEAMVGRPTQVERAGKAWVVTVSHGPGPASTQGSTTLTIDAKTGRVASYSDEVTEVTLVKPIPPPPTPPASR
jgi:hypothetical protein